MFAWQVGSPPKETPNLRPYPSSSLQYLFSQNIWRFLISTGKKTIVSAESQMPPAPNHNTPELLLER